MKINKMIPGVKGMSIRDKDMSRFCLLCISSFQRSVSPGFVPISRWGEIMRERECERWGEIVGEDRYSEREKIEDSEK